MRLVALLLAAVMAAPAGAQDWATRSVCDIGDPRIHPEVFAPTSLEDLKRAARSIPNGVGRYWRITSPEGETSHLWGTIHSNDPLLLALPEAVETQIEASRLVAVESDPVAPSRPAYQALVQSGHIWSELNDSGFDDLAIPGEIKQWIRNRFEGIGWGAGTPDILKLAVVAEFLLSDPCADFAQGIYPIQDFRIQMLGAIAGARILGLEEPRAFYHRLTDGRSAKLTEAIIAVYGSYLNPSWRQANSATTAALYLQGELGLWMAWEAAYFANMFEDGRGTEWLHLTDGYMLTERNHSFLDRALPELQQGGVFMAIGCFHLPGHDGMIALLREKGYVVDRIPLPGESL